MYLKFCCCLFNLITYILKCFWVIKEIISHLGLVKVSYSLVFLNIFVGGNLGERFNFSMLSANIFFFFFLSFLVGCWKKNSWISHTWYFERTTFGWKAYCCLQARKSLFWLYSVSILIDSSFVIPTSVFLSRIDGTWRWFFISILMSAPGFFGRPSRYFSYHSLESPRLFDYILPWELVDFYE